MVNRRVLWRPCGRPIGSAPTAPSRPPIRLARSLPTRWPAQFASARRHSLRRQEFLRSTATCQRELISGTIAPDLGANVKATARQLIGRDREGGAASHAGDGSLDDDLHLVAGGHAVRGGEAVEDAEAFDLTVAQRHAAR